MVDIPWPLLIFFALILGPFAIFLISAFIAWIWNTTVTRAVDWAQPISLWDAFKLLMLFLLLSSGLHLKIGS